MSIPDTSKGISSQLAYDLALNNDCEVVTPSDLELQIDCDTKSDFSLFKRQVKRLTEFSDIIHTWTDVKSRNGNVHVLVTLRRPLPVVERIMLQACLGSDRTREILSYARVLQGDPNPVLLLRPNRKLLTTGGITVDMETI